MASIIRDIVQFCLLVFLLLVAALYMAVAVEDNLTPKAVSRTFRCMQSPLYRSAMFEPFRLVARWTPVPSARTQLN